MPGAMIYKVPRKEKKLKDAKLAIKTNKKLVSTFSLMN